MDAQRNLSGTEERADARRPHDVDRLAELVQRAQQGDVTALPLLREALEADPSLWQEYGDLAAQAQEVWLQLLAGTDYLLAESVRLKLAAALAAQRQREREAEWARRRRERGRWDAKTETVQRLIEVSDLLVRAALLAAGFHQHERGAWRRKHGRSA